MSNPLSPSRRCAGKSEPLIWRPENSWRSAPFRRYASPVMWALHWADRLLYPVLEFGCGWGANWQFFEKELWIERDEFPAFGYDPFTSPEDKDWGPTGRMKGGNITRKEMFREEWETVLVFFVLNVIPESYRHDIYRDLHRLIAERFFFTVPIKKIYNGTVYEDGYLTKNGTFVRGFTKEEILDELQVFGFKPKDITRSLRSRETEGKINSARVIEATL